MSEICGVLSATVKDVKDPDGMGRVKVEYSWMEGQNTGFFAPVATLMAGGTRGSWFMPEVGDEVLVAFERGDPSHPFIVGFLWNGKDKPPSTITRRRILQSVNGHYIEFYDPEVKDGDAGY